MKLGVLIVFSLTIISGSLWAKTNEYPLEEEVKECNHRTYDRSYEDNFPDKVLENNFPKTADELNDYLMNKSLNTPEQVTTTSWE